MSAHRIGVGLALALASGLSQAVDFSYSGFANVTAGRVFSSGGIDVPYFYPDPEQWKHCPCYIADFSHGSVYDTRWSFAPESRLGLQGTATVNADLSFTAQVMARHAAQKAKVELEWAFMSYNISPKFTLQVGRKRLPLFFYSDFQDVSFAYNWARVPPDVYGWAVVNYNGANLTYRDDIAGWAVKSSAYMGREHSKDNPISKLESATRTDINWERMVGIDLEINRDWFTARASYNRSRQQAFQWKPSGKEQSSPDPAVFGIGASAQAFTSLSFNIDKGDWVGRSELSLVQRAPARGGYRGQMFGLGYRLGNFLPMVTVSRLNSYSGGDAPTLVEVDRNIGLTVRYQLSDTSSLKAQFDRSRWDYLDGTGTVRKLVTVSYDLIF